MMGTGARLPSPSELGTVQAKPRRRAGSPRSFLPQGNQGGTDAPDTGQPRKRHELGG